MSGCANTTSMVLAWAKGGRACSVAASHAKGALIARGVSNAQVLLSARGNADSRDVNHQTPIFYAIRHGHAHCARALLETPSAVAAGAVDSRGQTPLFGVKDVASCRLLLDRRCDPNAVDTHGQTALYYAAKAGALEIVKLLTGAGADANARDRNRDSPLFYAAQQGARRRRSGTSGRPRVRLVGQDISGSPTRRTSVQSRQPFVSACIPCTRVRLRCVASESGEAPKNNIVPEMKAHLACSSRLESAFDFFRMHMQTCKHACAR